MQARYKDYGKLQRLFIWIEQIPNSINKKLFLI